MPSPTVSAVSNQARPAETRDLTDPTYQEALELLIASGVLLADILVDPHFPISEVNKNGPHSQARLKWDVEVGPYRVMQSNYVRLGEVVAAEQAPRIRKAIIANVGTTPEGHCDVRCLSGAHRCAVCLSQGLGTIPAVLVTVPDTIAARIGWEANAGHGQPNDREERNQRIIHSYLANVSISEMAQWPGLSEATVRNVIEQHVIEQLIEQTSSLNSVPGIHSVPWRSVVSQLMPLTETTELYGSWRPVLFGLLRHAANANYTADEIGGLAEKLRRKFSCPENALDHLEKQINRDRARTDAVAASRAAGRPAGRVRRFVDKIRKSLDDAGKHINKMQTMEDIFRMCPTPEERKEAYDHILDIRVTSATTIELLQQCVTADQMAAGLNDERGAA